MLRDTIAAFPAGGDPASPTRGTNQAGGKLYNERLVLSLIRMHGSLSKVEIARITGLSSQTSSVIMKQLEREGLLLREKPLRGKVGQPSIPFSLNPDGAFSIGFKFGRRSADLVLMDLVGTVRKIIRSTYAHPEPRQLEHFIRTGVADINASLTGSQANRICGLGIAAPFEMWSWEAEVGTPHSVMEAWRTYDIAEEVRKIVPRPVYFYKDSTAACAAELSFAARTRYPNFLYVFIATLIGGGVVIDGNLFPGRSGYAGSFGSVLVPGLSCEAPAAQRLIRRASIYILEEMLRREGMDLSVLDQADDWSGLGPSLQHWIDQVADSLSMAIGSAIAIIDFDAVVIDGAFPAAVRSQIVERTRRRFLEIELQGVAPVDVVEGTIGRDARVLGAACLPLLANFSHDRSLLFRTVAGREQI